MSGIKFIGFDTSGQPMEIVVKSGRVEWIRQADDDSDFATLIKVKGREDPYRAHYRGRQWRDNLCDGIYDCIVLVPHGYGEPTAIHLWLHVRDNHCTAEVISMSKRETFEIL